MQQRTSSRSGKRIAIVAILSVMTVLAGLAALTLVLASNQPPTPSTPTTSAPATTVPTSTYTVTTMFGNGNGTCMAAGGDVLQAVQASEGSVCVSGGTIFEFYRYTGTEESYQAIVAHMPGVTLNSQTECSAKYTGSIDVPGLGRAPAVFEVYRHSPFMAVTLARPGTATPDQLLAPRYRVADPGAVCAGG
jgi:hypothetical protein